MTDAKTTISAGKAVLGIEFGSTRIKAVLIGPDCKPIAQGSHTWENRLENGLWTYSIEDIWGGLQDCYQNLRKDVDARYGVEIESLAAIGISAMMHGYMAFDKNGEIQVPFRTWRNTNTGAAAAELSELFGFNIPLRWSISHLYQCMLDGEEHVAKIDYLTTLAGYIHWKLTGRRVLGVGDASGMLPVGSETKTYCADMVEKFDSLAAPKGYPWKLLDILPESYAGRSTLIGILNDICTELPKWADPDTGVWYQVLDQPGREGNYLEATCSAMFSYTFLKGVRMGYLSSDLLSYAMELYGNVVEQFISTDDEEGHISINHCCSVGGLGGANMRMGDFAYYLSEKVVSNDCKGVGPFIWASLEMERIK